ncbi:trifunctional transcriptional activator/DNA repair protein Ada/methylated-DNA--[protein]-cysteine S-methyltransferase [bacterium]|nr:trifunctional transcriptional activator/DNA repair protein Ada/methylated-DNA--[protein]-cysteine S-methyltransferase [bacterium]
MNTITVKEMETAFLNKDATYDGIFFTGVRTTGIFCKPSCSARKPLPENLSYFSNAREALFAGYRPCLRCQPLEAGGAHPDWVRELLTKVDGSPEQRIKDSDLQSMGIEPETARRYFLKRFGMTFQAYCRARRLGSAFQLIREGATLDEVPFDSGYESHSGFREAFGKLFGKAPGQSRSDELISVDWVDSPLGPLVLAASGKGVCLLEFTDRRMLEKQFDTLRKRFQCAVAPGKNPYTEQLKNELSEYFKGERKKFDVPLYAPGTPFEEKVWQALKTIPYGETWSYFNLARTIGDPAAVRAVGTANGKNRIAIVIPCHRVVNKDGKLGGYGGGLWRKQYLLDLERKSAGSHDLLF